MAQVSYLENEGIKISRGMVKNVIPVHRAGYNSSLQNGVEEVIWSYSDGLYYANTANVVSIVSSSSSDTGVDVTIDGLDSNWNMISETIRVNGTTSVVTSNSFIRVLATVNTGSNTAIGNITFSQNGNENVVAYIIDGVGRGMKAAYSIPAGYTGYLYKGDASVGKGGDAEVKMKVRYFGKTWVVGHVAQVYESQYNYDFPFPSVLPEKTDIQVTAKTTKTGTSIGCNFDILLVKNPNQ